MKAIPLLALLLLTLGSVIVVEAQTSTPTHCGCPDCTEQVWNTVAASIFDASETGTCGERIQYVMQEGNNEDEISACRLVAGVEYPTICGRACNPDRCNGRYAAPPPAAPRSSPNPIQLGPTTDLYCFPPYTARQQWTNVWGKYNVQVKEDVTAACGPGANRFSRDNVQLLRENGSDDQLVLRFQQQGDFWTGAEVRVVLPDAEMPFGYGSYSFSVASILVHNSDGSVKNTPLPPSLVVGLFSWDDTEDFSIRENFNHEIDIEISTFATEGGPDVNFLVQPPGRPQWLREYSGGSGTAAYSQQEPHTHTFDWAPNRVEWSSTTGLVHSFSTESALFYGHPDHVQCLEPTNNVEIRMNLWSLDNANLPTNMAEGQYVEVIIDNFAYTPSGVTSVQDGGACTKHCQCNAASDCVEGACINCEAAPGAFPSVTNPPSPDPDGSPLCSAHSQCSHLGGNCCPTNDNVILACCANFGAPTAASSPSPMKAAPSPTYNTDPDPMCSAHPQCAHLSGTCCPTGNDNVMLACCSTNGDGAPAPPPAPTPTSTTPLDPRLCSAHPNCELLVGPHCCPTSDNTMLDCCSNFWVPTPAPSTTDAIASMEDPTSKPSFRPSAAPTETSGPICFSAIAKVQVEHKDEPVTMQALKIGDRVLTSKNIYEPIYAFGHLHATQPATFLQISTNNGTSSSVPLEISADHLLFVKEGKRSGTVRAGTIKVGDILFRVDVGPPAPSAVVTQITTVQRKGLYAPLTGSGTIVVDGILASTYAGVPTQHDLRGACVEIGRSHYTVGFLRQVHVIHLWLSPLRLGCRLISSRWCESHNENGMLEYGDYGLKLLSWVKHQQAVVEVALLASVLAVTGAFAAIEMLLSLHGVLLFLAAVVAWKIARRNSAASICEGHSACSSHSTSLL